MNYLHILIVLFLKTGDKFRKSFIGKREHIVSFQIYIWKKGQGISGLLLMSRLFVSSNGYILHM